MVRLVQLSLILEAVFLALLEGVPAAAAVQSNHDKLIRGMHT